METETKRPSIAHDTIQISETRNGRTAYNAIMVDQRIANLSKGRIVEIAIGDSYFMVPVAQLQRALDDLDRIHNEENSDGSV